MPWLESPEIPDWVTETPEVSYHLVTSGNALPGDEEWIAVTYDEYREIKLHLAKLRGYKITEIEPKGDGFDRRDMDSANKLREEDAA